MAPKRVQIGLRHGQPYRFAHWTPENLVHLTRHLRQGGSHALEGLSRERLAATWCATVEAFLDPSSCERQQLDSVLLADSRLSQAGLNAALLAIGGGLVGGEAHHVFATLQPGPGTRPPARGVTLLVLASNLPGLGLQLLLPALALRRPVIIKSPSAEPTFSPAFINALGRREPALAQAYAAVTWRGGRRTYEDPLLAEVDRVVAYGEGRTLADLESRVGNALFGFGPRASLAVVDAGADLETAARGLARDVALFDQRGCLSVQAVYTDGDAPALARRLALELAELADHIPAGPLEPAQVSAVQQLRAGSEMRGLPLPSLRIDAGTVVLEPDTAFRPSPGLRTVRIHPLADLDRLPEILAPWRDRLQGVALSGGRAERLETCLRPLGVTRFACPGELQSPDASWQNGGVDPRTVLVGME